MEVKFCQNFHVMKQNCLMKFCLDVVYQQNSGSKDEVLLTYRLEFKRTQFYDLHSAEVPYIINVKMKEDF